LFTHGTPQSAMTAVYSRSSKWNEIDGSYGVVVGEVLAGAVGVTDNTDAYTCRDSWNKEISMKVINIDMNIGIVITRKSFISQNSALQGKQRKIAAVHTPGSEVDENMLLLEIWLPI